MVFSVDLPHADSASELAGCLLQRRQRGKMPQNHPLGRLACFATISSNSEHLQNPKPLNSLNPKILKPKIPDPKPRTPQNQEVCTDPRVEAIADSQIHEQGGRGAVGKRGLGLPLSP